jgi:GNAT superfamily N-acetyltransferase
MDDAIIRATVADTDDLAPLFDAYRVFYGQPADLDLARSFLLERLRTGESVVFIARDAVGAAVGFTQLYPSFSSSGCARIFILNDLFVAPQARKRGIGLALLRTAADLGRSAGAIRLTLLTAVENHTAQSLYQAAGWRRSDAFLTYNLPL